MTRDVLSSRGQLSRVLDKRGGGAFPRDRALLSAPPNSTKRHDTPDRKLGIENVFDFPISYLLLKRILKISADFSFSVHCTLSFAIYSREIIRVKMINFREKFQIKRFPSRNETRIIYLNCPTFANANRNLFHINLHPNARIFLPLNVSSQEISNGTEYRKIARRVRCPPPASLVAWKPLSCIPVTPYPVATWVKPRINQVSLSWFTASRVDKIADGKSAPRFYPPLVTWREEQRGSIHLPIIRRVCESGTTWFANFMIEYLLARLSHLGDGNGEEERSDLLEEEVRSFDDRRVKFSRRNLALSFAVHRDFRFSTVRGKLTFVQRGNDWIVLFNHRCTYDVTYWTLIILYIFKYTLFIVLDNGKVSRCLFLFTHPFVTRYRQHHVPTSWKNSLKLRRGNGAKMFKDHKDFHRWESFVVIVARTQACNYRTFINNYF